METGHQTAVIISHADTCWQHMFLDTAILALALAKISDITSQNADCDQRAGYYYTSL